MTVVYTQTSTFIRFRLDGCALNQIVLSWDERFAATILK